MKRTLKSLAGTLAAVALAAACFARGDAAEVFSPFGVFNDYTVEGQRYDVSLAEELGNGWARLQLPWFRVEPENGKFTFEAADQLIGLHERAGIKLFVTILCTSPWGTREFDSTRPWSASPPHDLERYEQFVRTLAERYKGRVAYWQIEHEVMSPRFWKGSKEEYIDLLRGAYRAIKGTDPEARVVLHGFPDGMFRMIREGDRQAKEFFDYVMRESYDCCDALDVHQYFTPETIVHQTEVLRTAMEEMGYRRELIASEAGDLDIRIFVRPDLPVVSELLAVPGVREGYRKVIDGGITEPKAADFARGLKTDPRTRPILERYQARALAKRVCLTLSRGFTQIHWIGMRDDERLVSGWTRLMQCLVDTDDRKKPHYYAYRQLIGKLAGMTKAEQLRAAPAVFRFSFADRPAVYVAWNDEGPARADLRREIPAGKAVVTRIVTEQGTTDAEADAVTADAGSIPVDATPVIIEPAAAPRPAPPPHGVVR